MEIVSTIRPASNREKMRDKLHTGTETKKAVVWMLTGNHIGEENAVNLDIVTREIYHGSSIQL